MKQYKERRLYFSGHCETCGKSFQSFKRARIKRGLCRTCRSGVLVAENQIILFDEVKETFPQIQKEFYRKIRI